MDEVVVEQRVDLSNNLSTLVLHPTNRQDFQHPSSSLSSAPKSQQERKTTENSSFFSSSSSHQIPSLMLLRSQIASSSTVEKKWNSPQKNQRKKIIPPTKAVVSFFSLSNVCHVSSKMKAPVVEWEMTVLPPHFADLHGGGVPVPDHVQLLQGQAVLQPQAIRPRTQEPRRLAGALPQEHQGEQVRTDRACTILTDFFSSPYRRF